MDFRWGLATDSAATIPFDFGIPGMSKPDSFVVTTAISDVQRLVTNARRNGARIGCVPTMGALHAGHVSLFEVCRKRADFNVATIFVNPTQFAPHEDLAKYPRPLEDDLKAAQDAGMDVVFTPSVDTIYPRGFSTYVNVEELSKGLEGEVRPNHFRGVATVVLKLFNIVKPDVAVFGAKDFQQQAIIRRMTADLDLGIEIVTAPTVREPDGLAMSSRNIYLSARERKSALSLSQSLALGAERIASGESDLASISNAMLSHMRSASGVEPDYAVIADPDTLEPLSAPRNRMVLLVAARVGATRLIDNREVAIKPIS
jgi:pantoate--beta-alanine ligase